MRERVVASSIMILAVVFGVGSLALFIGFPVGSVEATTTRWPLVGILLWDGLLSLVFFLQHSGMVRRQFRAKVAGVIPPPYYRAVYTIATGVVLAGVVVLWQPSRDHLLLVPGPLSWAARALILGAVALFLWGAFTLRDLDLFGLGSIRMHLRGGAEPAPVFIVRGPYRWVRHPWYLGAILLFWSSTDITSDRLLFNILWTGWIYVATRWEEADLLKDFGCAYEAYRRQVPMLIPWRRPYAASPAAAAQ
ncbi:NnrU family protein [uncultured Paludibaculum sp.]|uniref:methyltransferase family protein n=1 Tax=uncultured Paludibaculum sp. TaxID=1765020 RepID=UPI002AABE063|nr:NnrU family protein [uncultured Paludibaculum sp.]